MKAHPAAELFPLLGETELAELAADIRANGLLRPLVRWPSRDLLVDGRNRLAACKLAKVAPHWEDIEFFDDTEAARWIVSANLRRRHLTESQRAMLGARLAEMYAEGARERQATSTGGASPQLRANLPQAEQQGRARDQAARDVAVSPRSVQAAKTVLEEGAPELAAAVDAGKVAVSTAADIASLPPEEQREVIARGEREILAKAKEIKAGKAAVRRAERVEKLALISSRNDPLSASPTLYPVIYADPPWRYDQHQDSNRGVNNHYPTMPLADIAALPVGAMATPEAVLFLWATSPLLPDALEVLRAWGFTYKASWVWVKTSQGGAPTRGMGFWGRVSHELVLIGTRGEMPTPAPEARPPTVFMAPRLRHSEKPFSVRQAIDGCYPTLPKIELFARAAAPGWATWGNQAPEAPEEEAHLE